MARRAWAESLLDKSCDAEIENEVILTAWEIRSVGENRASGIA